MLLLMNISVVISVVVGLLSGNVVMIDIVRQVVVSQKFGCMILLCFIGMWWFVVVMVWVFVIMIKGGVLMCVDGVMCFDL